MKTSVQDDIEDRKVSQFFQRISDYGNAIFHGPGGYVVEETVDFVAGQFARFNIPIDDEIADICVVGPAMVTEHIDYTNPYLLFYGYSDVCCTDDWRDYTYELTEDGRVYWELDPTELETLRYIPGQAEAFFNQYIAMPGIDAFPTEIADPLKQCIDDCIVDNIHFGPYYDNRCKTAKDLYEILADRNKTEDGYVNESRVMAYFNLSVWASLLWVFGPLGREMRLCGSDVTEVALEYGECIVYRGEVISPNYYRKLNRPMRSCYKCGIQAWCTEDTVDDYGSLRKICEGCFSQGMIPRCGATCGTKFCRDFDCKHNSYYQAGTAAVREVMRTRGQLAQRAASKREMLVAMNQDKRLLGT